MWNILSSHVVTCKYIRSPWFQEEKHQFFCSSSQKAEQTMKFSRAVRWIPTAVRKNFERRRRLWKSPRKSIVASSFWWNFWFYFVFRVDIEKRRKSDFLLIRQEIFGNVEIDSILFTEFSSIFEFLFRRKENWKENVLLVRLARSNRCFQKAKHRRSLSH